MQVLSTSLRKNPYHPKIILFWHHRQIGMQLSRVPLQKTLSHALTLSNKPSQKLVPLFIVQYQKHIKLLALHQHKDQYCASLFIGRESIGHRNRYLSLISHYKWHCHPNFCQIYIHSHFIFLFYTWRIRFHYHERALSTVLVSYSKEYDLITWF